MAAEEGEDRPWSELAPDLLRLILRRGQFLEGCGPFSAVCKTWNSFVFNTANNLPGAMVIESQLAPPCLLMTKENKIFHPLNHQLYDLNIPELSKSPNSTLIRASNYGWLLMASVKDVFFFNPFTRIKLQLPDLPSACANFQSISFFSPPTSPICVVFAFAYLSDLGFMVCTVRRGENKWRILAHKDRSGGDSINYSSCNPVVYKGSYCYMNNSGDLFFYNPKKRKKGGKWCILRKGLQVDRHWQKYLVNSSDEELLAVFLKDDGSWIEVCRLKSSRSAGMFWETVKDLGSRVLYLNHNSCYCERTPHKETGNKIFFPRFCDHGNGLFYSLATGKYHSMSGCSHRNFLESKEPLTQAPRSKAPLHCTWIKPPYPSAC